MQAVLLSFDEASAAVRDAFVQDNYFAMGVNTPSLLTVRLLIFTFAAHFVILLA